MKFRGKIIDVACLNHFTRVITTISKLTKICVLRLTPDNLFFVLSGKVANGGVSMWCELSQIEVLQESKMMIPDCHRRLAIAHADLLQLLEAEEDLAESEEYKEARNILDSVKLEG